MIYQSSGVCLAISAHDMTKIVGEWYDLTSELVAIDVDHRDGARFSESWDDLSPSRRLDVIAAFMRALDHIKVKVIVLDDKAA